MANFNNDLILEQEQGLYDKDYELCSCGDLIINENAKECKQCYEEGQANA